MRNLNTSYPIGIDINGDDLYATQLRHSRRGPMLKGVVHREIHEQSEDESNSDNDILPLLKELAAYSAFRGRRAVIRLPPRHVYSFPIRFQLKQNENLEGAIVRETREYLPFPVEEAVLDYPSIMASPSEGEDGYRVNVAAIRRELVERYLSLLKRAGFAVEAVETGISALIRLHNYLQAAPNDPTILCHIDRNRTILSALTKEGIVAELNAQWGIQKALRRVQTNLELGNDPSKAVFLLRTFGLTYEDRKSAEAEVDFSDMKDDSMQRAVYQIIVPSVEELINELHKTISYLRSEASDANFQEIHIYGQSGMIRDLDRFVARRLNIKTRIMNPMLEFPLAARGLFPKDSDGSPFACALGLSLRKLAWL
jgi:type IV pilus assembly protein PilM